MPGHQNKLSLFWQEIKRRNVHRSLAIYAGTAFIILEAADIIFPRLGLPDLSIDVVLYLLILGAVVTLVVSWIFDLTSKGVEKTKALNEMQAGDKPVVSYGWKIATYVSLVVIVGLIIFNLAGGFKQVQAGSIQSLVVLPFDNFTGNEELDYFVSGMHASLIGDMGKINGLRVVSKTTSNTFKDLDKSIPEIASELIVDAVVETNVMCLGDNVCVQFKLFSAFPEEQLLWSKSYDSDMSNILNLYNWVIKDIANEIRLPLSPEQQTQLAKPRPIDPDAYELYLKGKFHMGFLTRESQQSALDYFNKALEIDPEYASAYAGIAGVWAFLKQMDYVTPDEANLKLEEFMSRALQLDNPSAEVYYYDGIKKVWTDFDWEGGESSLMRCLEINPNFSEARAYYSHLMMLLKRPEEMREQITLALEIDPKNPLIQVLATVELMIESKYDLCIDRAKQLQTMMPNNPLLMLVLFQSYTETDEYDLAIIELRKVFKQLADDIVIETLDREYSKAGFEKALNAAADNWTERFTGASAQHATMLYAYAGNTEKTLFWLERAYIRRDPSNPYLGVIPYLRPYHDEPRYIEIVQRMKLPIGAFDS
ncbi:MAG: hypothetical protein E4H10_14190 [Bacteroidia bacterium]|nr:MAG: hypothetical protein E4H10_14190 [Bacteroidia bacterium]